MASGGAKAKVIQTMRGSLWLIAETLRRLQTETYYKTDKHNVTNNSSGENQRISCKSFNMIQFILSMNSLD